MVEQKTKISRILICIGSILLIIMGFFHGSGYFYFTNSINESNADGVLKEIVPVLFAHPSIHLLGLSALGILTLYLNYESKKILFLLTVLILIDTLLAYSVGGLIPGILLTIPVVCFSIAGLTIKKL